MGMQPDAAIHQESSRSRIAYPAAALLVLLFFFIPIEHKYDKVFRFYSLTLIPAGLGLPHHYEKKIYFYLSDLAMIVLFTIGLHRFRLVKLQSLLLGAIFFLAAFSIALSPLATYPIPYTRLFQLFTPFTLFLFLASGLIPKEKLFPIFSWSLLATGIVQAGIASCQYMTQKMVGLRFFGEQPFCATISCPGGRRWLLDAFSTSGDTLSGVYRAMGTMPHPNVLGGLLVATLLITGYFFHERRPWRLFLAPAYLLQLFALATTYSRSAIFAYLIGACLWLLRIQHRRAPFLLILISATLIGGLFSEQYLHRGGIVNYTPTARISDQERFYYQNIAERMIAARPLTGVGYGQFSIHAPSFGADPKNTSATHNIYLILAAETGLLSLFAFLLWIGTLFRGSLRSGSTEVNLFFAIFCAFLFIGLCDFYPIAFHQGALLFFGSAGLLAAWSRTPN